MIITLCGSTRYLDEWHEWNGRLSSAGHIVFSLALFKRDLHDSDGPQKTTLDLVHLAKIEESDAIFVLNVDDYIGESTKREIAWARIRRKDVIWLQAGSVHRRAGERSYDEWVGAAREIGKYMEEIAHRSAT
jgi:hypothetical protein